MSALVAAKPHEKSSQLLNTVICVLDWCHNTQPMDQLAERIGYRFTDEGLRAQVFSHRSFRHENLGEGAVDNERLEFLGDAILGFIISRMLFDRFPDRREGELSRLRAHLVSAYHLAKKARARELGLDLRLGRGEEMSGGREKDSILADTYESLIAGIFVDGGLEAACEFIEREFGAEIDGLRATWPVRDHKSLLQEQLHTLGRSEPVYQVVEESGPDHRKSFMVSVSIGEGEIARGTGSSKKSAQQAAARAALEVLGLITRAEMEATGSADT